jgi:hypothetical protein
MQHREKNTSKNEVSTLVRECIGEWVHWRVSEVVSECIYEWVHC